MSRTGKGKRLYINIPYKLYAAILQDIESRPRGVSTEHAVQECIRDKYGKVKIKREYLVRAGNEVSIIPEEPLEAVPQHGSSTVPMVYAASRGHGRPASMPMRERMLQRKRVRENFSMQLAMMTGGAH